MAAQDSAIQAMLDKAAITEVLYRYCRGVDRGDVALIESVYHDDAIDDHGMWKGRGKEFGAWITAALGDTPTAHMVTNVLIELRGDVAFSESYCLAISEEADIKRTVWNRYIDRFERRKGEWKIADRVVVLDVSRGEAQRANPEMAPGFSWGKRNKQDLSYRR